MSGVISLLFACLCLSWVAVTLDDFDLRRLYAFTVSTNNWGQSVTTASIQFQIEGTTGTTEFVAKSGFDQTGTTYTFNALLEDVGDAVSLTILSTESDSFVINSAGVDGTTFLFKDIPDANKQYKLVTSSGCSYITVNLDGSSVINQKNIGDNCDKVIDSTRQTYELGISTGKRVDDAAYFRISNANGDTTSFVGTTAITDTNSYYYFYAPMENVGDADVMLILNMDSGRLLVNGADVDGNGFHDFSRNYWLGVTSGYEGVGCSYIEVSTDGSRENTASTFRASQCDLFEPAEDPCEGASHETYSSVSINNNGAVATVAAMEFEDFEYQPNLEEGAWRLNDTFGAPTGNTVSWTDFRGTGTLEFTGSNQYGRGGDYPIETRIQINEAGTYRVLFRTQTAPFDRDDLHNDVWMRCTECSKYYGYSDSEGTYVCPTNDNTGEISESPSDCTTDFGQNQGWFKVHKSECQCWNWSTNLNSDHDFYSYHVEIDTPGVYNFEVSARSNHFFVDRFALVMPTGGARFSDIVVSKLNNLDTPCTE